jgi:hypothetical protein
VELLAIVLGLLLLLLTGLALVPLTEPEPPLPEDDEDDEEDPLLGVMAASVGVTILACPAKSHAVLAFFWLA